MSALADILGLQIVLAELPAPVGEYQFAKEQGRRFRFDFAWPDRMIAVEVEGGQWINSRHRTPKGYENDCRKYNLAARLGWKVLRFPTTMIKSGEALAELVRVLE